MKIDRQKELIQQQAFEAWLTNGKIGTLEMATGLN